MMRTSGEELSTAITTARYSRASGLRNCTWSFRQTGFGNQRREATRGVLLVQGDLVELDAARTYQQCSSLIFQKCTTYPTTQDTHYGYVQSGAKQVNSLAFAAEARCCFHHQRRWLVVVTWDQAERPLQPGNCHRPYADLKDGSGSRAADHRPGRPKLHMQIA